MTRIRYIYIYNFVYSFGIKQYWVSNSYLNYVQIVNTTFMGNSTKFKI